MKLFFYSIYILFFIRGLLQLLTNQSLVISLFSIVASIFGLVFLIKKYNQSYLSGTLILLLLTFMMSH
jgi:hypothetical protein